MRGVIAWFARNSVVANLMLFVIVAAGALTVGDLKKEIFPSFTLDSVSISVKYRGAAPEEVEEAICVRVEEAIQGIEGIKKITATAREGSASFQVEILSDYDARRVMEDIKARVDGIDTFPEEAEMPVVQEVTTRNQVISVSISGETDMATLKTLGEQARDELSALPEISHVELLTTPPYEISIEVSEDALRRWGLRFDDIANAVRGFSVDTPGGSVKTQNGEVLLRTDGQAYTGGEYGRLLLLTRPDGTRIHLSDVATVVDGFEEQSVSAQLNGTPAVVVQVYRVGEQSAIEVADATHRYIAEASQHLPEGITVAAWHDRAKMLKDRIQTLTKNAATGLALVFVVLALFMRLRLAFWVCIGIPVTFLGALAMMPVFDVSINMITLFAFILVLGIVVDDAIIVAENIHSTQVRRNKGLSGAVRGTHEVLVPVTFGVLTTMAAFAPMLFVDGMLGKVMPVFPLIILPVLFFSLLESTLILPCHLKVFRKRNTVQGSTIVVRGWDRFFDSFSNAVNWVIRRIYRPVLAGALEWRYLTLSAGIGCGLLTAGMVAGGFVKTVVFPVVESDNVVAYVTMPQDAPIEVTRAAVETLENAATELRREIAAEYGNDQFALILSTVGEHPYRVVQSGPMAGPSAFMGEHLGEVNIELRPAETRRVPGEEIATRWRELVGQVPGAVELNFTYDLIGGGKAIDIEFNALDLAVVRAAVDATKEKLRGYDGVVEITDSFRGGKPEVKLALTPEGEALGLTMQSLGRQVRQGFFGEEAQRIQRGRDDVRVMVRYPAQARRSLGDLERARIRTPSGAEVPFSTVAVASMGRSPATITRVNRSRAISVQAAVDESITTGGAVTDDLKATFLPALVEKYSGLTYSIEGDEADFAESLDSLNRGFSAALFVIFAMLAIPLKSYIEPMIVLAAVPFGFIGAVWGHVLLGLPLSFLSICGMVALAGVVVNDGLVLVSFIHNFVRRQGSIVEAVRRAGETRFRPILLTSLTTSAGVTPLMLEKSLQAQFLIPMAVSLSFGVLFATAVTLLLVPSLYMILDDFKRLVRLLVRGNTRSEFSVKTVPAVGQETASGD